MAKVLIVEDDRIWLSRLTKSLESYQDQFEVVSVSDGLVAIDVLNKQQISLVVTDIQMPRVNGLVLLEYINRFHPDIPCFVMTAYATSRIKSKLPEDLLRFFPKPFAITDLANAIIAALNRNVESDSRKGISLLNFLNMIQMYQSSCMIEVGLPDKASGVLYFENGLLYDAECGDLTGEAAALELIAGETTAYKLIPSPQKEIVRRVKTDLRDLIRNVTGGIDEIERGA